MFYYEVDTLIDLAGLKKSLTYSYGKALKPMTIVSVPYGRRQILALVEKQVKSPSFVTKPIRSVIFDEPVNQAWLKLINWFRSFYPLRSGELQNLFLPVLLNKTPKNIKENESVDAKSFPELTPDQTQAISVIQKTTKPVILHGDMGSGKTITYLKLASTMLKKGKSVLLLSPEIPLAEQLYLEAQRFLPNAKISLYHSDRTDKQRLAVWQACLNSQPRVVVGTRSALFLPLNNLGFIAVDEMHEGAYKQHKNPRYNAVDVAAAVAKFQEAKIVYGSATPPIKEYAFAEQKSYPIVRLKGLAKNQVNQRFFEIIDQKKRDNFNKDPYLSDQLLKAIDEALKNNQQALIFHNRRGTARFIVCDNCGWSLTCPRCESHLVYHHDSHLCQCHVCGFSESLPTECPDCHNQQLLLKSIGVKALEQCLRDYFPSARIARFDSDNSKAESLGSRLGELKDRQVDIIIGTQLVAKGLDLPNLKVVGITNADSTLYLPDFTSAERMFQLIMQATGRVGRGHGDGLCIIQTYQPQNPVFEQLKQGDWLGFYEAELAERKLFKYPPYSFLLKLICRRKTDNVAQKNANAFADELRKIKPALDITGPSPAFFSKVNGQYQWQILVKSNDRQKLLQIARQMPINWQADLDPISLL